VEVLLVRGVRRLYEQLAAHAQVHQQTHVVPVRGLEDQPEVLAAPTGLDNERPLDPSGEIGGSGQVPSHHAGPLELR